jgi:mutator protein MutT
MEPTVVRVVAAVISDGERLLVCQRPLHKRHGGLWEFPGGKCEPGETDAAAAKRELREELGVEVVEVRAPEFTILDPGSQFEIAFVPVNVVGAPVCHEHIALRWGRPEELAELPLAPSDNQFIEARRVRLGQTHRS